MKKLFSLLFLVLVLTGCTQIKTNTQSQSTLSEEELIKLFVDQDTNIAYFVGTPSGIIYQATNSEITPYLNSEGKIINVNDYIEE